MTNENLHFPAGNGNRALVVQAIEGEPRILDTDLATRLGFAQARDIRKLIERHKAALEQMGVCATVAQTPGPQGGRPTSAYYLNRKQAIFITAKSETLTATDITIEIIERFDAYEQGAQLAVPAQESLTAKRTGGIVKAVVNRSLGDLRGEVHAAHAEMADLSRALIEVSQVVRGLVTVADSRVAALEYISVRQLLEEAGAEQRSRRSLNRRVGSALLRAAALSPGGAARKCPHRGVWLFQVDFAKAWMDATGNGWVRDHNDAVRGQGVIKFPRRNRRKPANTNGPQAAE